MKKLIYTFMILLLPVFIYSQPTVNGRFSLVTNNGTTYAVKVQISTNTGVDALGDATIPFTFNSSDLTYVSTTFQNFTGGDYYTATATNSPVNRVSLNITFNTGSGTIVSNTFMDVATITFATQDAAGTSNLTFAAPLEFFSTSFTTQWINGTFTNLNTIPLPVELTSFTANKINNNCVVLNWKTSTEINNYGFEIERRSQIEGWSKIGFVMGSGNSNSPKYYTFSDNSLSGSNKYHYRLKQIDNDGQSEFSETIEIELAPNSFELFQNYPNPFNPVTKVRFIIPSTGRVVIKLYDSVGEEVKEIINQDYDEGYHEVNVNSSDLASGIYFYKLVFNNFSAVKKLVIMK